MDLKLLSFRRLLYNRNDPGRKKKEEIKHMLDELDTSVRRTAPAELNEQRLQSYRNRLNEAAQLVSELNNIYKKQCKDLVNRMRGIDIELERRWKASRNNPESANWAQSLSKNKTDAGNGRAVSVTQVNERVRSKDPKKYGGGGNGNGDIAKVHGTDVPEKEHVTSIYYNTRRQTAEMLAASAAVLKSCERDFGISSTGYATPAKRTSANFPVSKPPAVKSQDYKIHSLNDVTHKIPKPLLPEYHGNVQESCDVDRKTTPPISSEPTRLDHVHDQRDQQSMVANDDDVKFAMYLEQMSKQSADNDETRCKNGSGHVKPGCSDAEQNIQLQTSGFGSGITSPAVSDFFKQFNDNQYGRRYDSSVSTVQNVTKPIAAFESRQESELIQSIDRTVEENRVEQTAEHPSSQSSEPVHNVALTQGSDSRPFESSDSKKLNRFERIQQRITSRPISLGLSSGGQSSEPTVQNAEPGSGATEPERSNRHAEPDVNQNARRGRQHRSGRSYEPAQNATISGSDSRQSEPSDSNQFDPKSLLGRDEYHQVISNAADDVGKSERHQVCEAASSNRSVNVGQMSYAGVVSRQTGQRENPQLHNMNHGSQNNYPPGYQSSRSANRNDIPHRQLLDERENPNSIVVNITYDEQRRPDRAIYQPPQHHLNNCGYNRHHYKYRQYPPAAAYQNYAQQQCHQHHNSQHPSHINRVMHKEQPVDVEMAVEQIEEQQQPEKPKIIVDEIQDMNCHFQNDDLKTGKDKMPKDEYMNLVRSKAEKFEPQIADAESFDFMEFFIIEENLNQYVGFLDATYTRDSEELTKQKIEIITYIKGLQEKLDEKRAD